MTETTPDEQPNQSPDSPAGDDVPDADGVSEDRLTGVALYDLAERHYVGGKHANKTAAKRDERVGRLLKADPDRYVLRRV